MTEQEATMAVEAMTVLDYFPSKVPAQALIAHELRCMCPTYSQAMWLVRRLSQLYAKWPGLREMRAAFCAKFRPADGIECGSEAYPDGIPSETESRGMIAGPERKALSAGVAASADPLFEKTVLEVADTCKMLEPKPFRTISESEDRVTNQLDRMGV